MDGVPKVRPIKSMPLANASGILCYIYAILCTEIKNKSLFK